MQVARNNAIRYHRNQTILPATNHINDNVISLDATPVNPVSNNVQRSCTNVIKIMAIFATNHKIFSASRYVQPSHFIHLR